MVIRRNNDVLTCEAFKAVTIQPPKHKHLTFLNKEVRATHLSLVDDTLVALDNYYRQNNKDDSQEQGLLNAVVLACRTVISKYPSAEKMDVFNEQVKNILATLGRNAKKASVSLEGEELSTARNYFEKNKAQDYGFTVTTKTLSEGYQNERTSYLENNKKKAFSASALNKVPEDYNTFIQQVKKDGGRTVDYLSKTDRLKWLVMVQAGVFTHPNGRLMKTPMLYDYAECRETDMWSMDRYGNLFYKGIGGDGAGRDHSFFNHSSFNAGNEVICAGTIIVNDGILAYIDNSSGHYKPTEANLRTALEILFSQGGIEHGDLVCVCSAEEENLYNLNGFLTNTSAKESAWDHANNDKLKLTKSGGKFNSLIPKTFSRQQSYTIDDAWQRAVSMRERLLHKNQKEVLSIFEQYMWDNCLKDKKFNSFTVTLAAAKKYEEDVLAARKVMMDRARPTHL